ncbi:MAG: hypothetical protein V7L29_25910 [Nostoc sp.]|uniref:hypothetical protein n=1 Tax=Nostoc sp. TaxID=1180 RepID=UPI002FF29855
MNSQLQQFLFNGDQFIKATLFKVEDASISLLWLLKLALAFLIITILSTLLKRLLKQRLLLKLGMSQGHRETISTLLSYGAGSLRFVIALQANGLNLAPLAVAVGGLGLGLALVCKRLPRT